jgi:hypothetical protein
MADLAGWACLGGLFFMSLAGSGFYSAPTTAPWLKIALSASQAEIDTMGYLFYASLVLLPLYSVVANLRRGRPVMFTVLCGLASGGLAIVNARLQGGAISFAGVCAGEVMYAIQQALMYSMVVDLLAQTRVPGNSDLNSNLLLLPFGVGAAIWPWLFYGPLQRDLVGLNWIQIVLCIIAWVVSMAILTWGPKNSHPGEAAHPLLGAEPAPPVTVCGEFFRHARDWTYWVEWVAFCCGSGTAIALSYNLGAVILSIDPGSDQSSEISLTTWGLGQLVGRSISCVPYLTGADLPGVKIFFGTSVGLLIACVWGWAGLTPNILLVWTFLVGAVYGLMWNMLLVIGMNERRLAPRVALSVLGILVLFSITPGQIAMNEIAGAIYDAHGERLPDGSVRCEGHECFHTTFIIYTAVAMVATLMTGTLLVRQCRAATVRDE